MLIDKNFAPEMLYERVSKELSSRGIVVLFEYNLEQLPPLIKTI